MLQQIKWDLFLLHLSCLIFSSFGLRNVTQCIKCDDFVEFDNRQLPKCTGFDNEPINCSEIPEIEYQRHLELYDRKKHFLESRGQNFSQPPPTPRPNGTEEVFVACVKIEKEGHIAKSCMPQFRSGKSGHDHIPNVPMMHCSVQPGSGGHNWTVCFCDSDGCNNAPTTRIPFTSIIYVFIGAVLNLV